MKRLLTLTFVVAAGPALAASYNPFSGEFYSLTNTNLIVLIAFLVFIGILVYFKIPGRLGEMLDKRAQNISSELEEARQLREEAQTLLASYERKQREVQDQADRIVAQARESAQQHAEMAKEEMRAQIERRVHAAEDQITSAETAAVKRVRDEAARIAVAAAGEAIRGDLSDERANALVDDAIRTVDAKLH